MVKCCVDVKYVFLKANFFICERQPVSTTDSLYFIIFKGLGYTYRLLAHNNKTSPI